MKTQELRPAQHPLGKACIVLMHPPGPDIGKRVELEMGRYGVGREADADISVPRDSVSRNHAELVMGEGGAWTVRDLGSTNGTFVNEVRVSQQALRDGDHVRFGDAVFKFLESQSIETQYHEEIYKLAIHDALTGLHNQRYLLDFLEKELSAAHRHGHPLSLVMFDIDHFKQINDTRSHLCGDEVLREIGSRLIARVRREDLVARYGGEEFAAVLLSTPFQGAMTFAESIRKLVGGMPFTFDDQSFRVTVSLGVACVENEKDVTVEELVRRADAALYESKRGGRDRVSYTA